MTAAHQLWIDDPVHYSPTLRCQAMGDAEDSNPAYFCRPMNDDQDRDERRDTPTISAPPPSEEATNPEASERPAIAPPAKMPDADELESTALARTEAPEWFKASFIGQALTKFSDDASDIRKGKDRQHGEQMRALRDLDGKLGRFGERIATLETNQRRLNRDVSAIQNEQERQSVANEQERRAIRSILTMALLRLEILENGHQDEALQGVRVLVVEDEAQLAKTLSRMLLREGATVHSAANWAETQAIVEEQAIDFALLDVRLGGEDGIQLAEWLMAKLELPKERVAIMTGHMDRTHDDLADELGLRVLAKPFGGDDLVRTIREGLDVTTSAAPPVTT
jgi:CheY-like chemotaxis protein